MPAGPAVTRLDSRDSVTQQRCHLKLQNVPKKPKASQLTHELFKAPKSLIEWYMVHFSLMKLTTHTHRPEDSDVILLLLALCRGRWVGH